MKRYVLVLLLMGYLLTSSYAQEGVPAFSTEGLDESKLQEFKAIADNLRCPTCTGLSVYTSDAPFSIQMKHIVKEQLSEGKSSEEILRFFSDRYGSWILRSPPKEGINWFLWLFPLVLLLMGIPILWLVFWRKVHIVTMGTTRSAEDILKEFHA